MAATGSLGRASTLSTMAWVTAKLEVSGSGAAELLEHLCDNRVAREVGQITYTQMLNRRGGIECDFTVARLAEDRFGIVTGTAFGNHDASWIRSHLPSDGSVTVTDVTSRCACFGLWGPKAREILTLRKRLNEIYVRHTGQPIEAIFQADA